MNEGLSGVLLSGLDSLGVVAAPSSVSAMLRHLDLLVARNEEINLTAVKVERDMVIKHAIDSATVLCAVPVVAGMRVLDVGSGAGFPGVVLKCLVSGVDLVLLESLAKRCRFLEEVGSLIAVQIPEAKSGFEVVWGRAEDVGHRVGYRETFDLVVARAVADLRVLAEYCLPFCRVGGEFVAMKGPSVDEELARAARAIRSLGGEIIGCVEVQLPEGLGERTLVRIKKCVASPRLYPRRAGLPTKAPLT